MANYKCGNCGKEGTNPQHGVLEHNYSCGQRGDPTTTHFCSEHCSMKYSKEGNAIQWRKELTTMDESIEMLKGIVKTAVEDGEQVPKDVISEIKFFKVKRAMLVLVLQGDRKAVQNLYMKKREVIGESLEEFYNTYGDGDDKDRQIYLKACDMAKWMADIGWVPWDI